MCFGARDGWVVFIHLFSMIGCDFALIDSVLNQLRCQFQIFGKKMFFNSHFTKKLLRILFCLCIYIDCEGETDYKN